MSDVDDLVAAMVKGDPQETVPLDIVTAMAQTAINSGWWQPAPLGGHCPCGCTRIFYPDKPKPTLEATDG